MVQFQARVTTRPFRYGPVRAHQPEAMADLRAMTTDNLSAGHVRELYGPGMIADAKSLAEESEKHHA